MSFQGRVVPGVKVAPVHQKPSAATKPQASGPSWDHAKGNGAGVTIPEQSIADELDDTVPF